jgi:ubiquinone/menaquinone biosynthesis C-methylase UbiE
LTDTPRDRWAAWLLERRQGAGDAAHQQMLETLRPVRDRVLDNAAVGVGDVVLDVGTGDGLIALGALDRVGERGRVVFSDISQACLDYCRALVEGDRRASFVLASIDDLSPVADESVDVVTTRSVLIFVAREAKAQAFREFFRVLRPGGRLSMFEPINRFGSGDRKSDRTFMGLDTAPVADLVPKVRAEYEAAAVGEETLIDFDERDLIAFAEDAGFAEISLDYEARITHGAAFGWAKTGCSPDWQTFLNTSPNPHAPTLAEVLDRALTPDERARFVEHVRQAYETNSGTSRHASAFLHAVKR